MSAARGTLGMAELVRFVEQELAARPAHHGTLFLVLPAPVAPALALARALPADAAFWRPPEGPAVAGLGAAWRREVEGPARCAQLEDALAPLWDGLAVAQHAAAPPLTPAVLGGFAFRAGAAAAAEWSAFGDGSFVMPRWSYVAAGPAGALGLALALPGDRARLPLLMGELERIVRCLAVPADVPAAARRTEVVRRMPRGEWIALVDTARAAIAAGEFAKVVLARQTRIAADAPFDVPALLGTLGELQPDAYLFGFTRGAAAFVGASPEVLVVKRGSTVQAEALAGTAQRAPGAGAAEAAATADALAKSDKDLGEHGLVVDGIRAALDPFCDTLDVAATPRVRQLPHVLHLATPMTGTLAADVPLTRLVGAIHPTPAMGGHPRERALQWIAAHEPVPRGWYAGPVGRIAANGDGEFAVAIRSALLLGHEALLYAGAGIVSDSDPAAEYDEAAAKERTILAALAG